MTWPAALPTAAVRVLRTAAGRRALQVVLLVGGLFTLGFLCGEQAHAADGAPVVTSPASTASTSSLASTPSTASSPSTPSVRSRSGTAGAVERLVGVPGKPGAQEGPAVPAEPTVSPASGSKAPGSEARGSEARGSEARGSEDPGSVGGQVSRPVTDRVIQGVNAHVVRPVGDVVRAVSGGSADARTKLPPLSSLPGLPESPSLPGLPGLEIPTIPGLPGVPGVPGVPGRPALPGQTLPAPGAGTSRPGSAVPSGVDGRDGKKRSGAVVTSVQGPQSPAGAGDPAGVSHGSAHPGGHHAVSAGHIPAPQAPADQPGGASSNGATADNGTPRHGDAHAVPLNHRAPLRLLPGAAAHVAADGTWDRHRDIPVSPA